jgi:aromatase
MSRNARIDQHVVSVDSDAASVFARLEDVSRWAEMFEPTIHGCELARRDNVQTIQLWATANGEPKTWVSDRIIDRDRHTIGFAHSVTSPPVAEMSGQWSVVPRGEHACTVQLQHTYRAVDDDEESLAWIEQAVDTNSRKELEALKTACEREQDSGSAPFSFVDEVQTDADPRLVFAFLDRGDRWAERLEHVAEVSMQEYPGGLQFLRMSTRTPDNDTHVTESFRLSQGPAVLRYKQTTLPRLLSLHTGVWTISPAGEKWRVSSAHTVAIRTNAVTDVLGADATVEQAQTLARRNLGDNSRRTLEAAVRWASGPATTR